MLISEYTQHTPVTAHSPHQEPEQIQGNTWALDDSEPSSCVLWADSAGTVVDCTDNITMMFGHRWDQLLGHHVSVLLPAMSDMALLQAEAINPLLVFLCRSGIPFRVVRTDGSMDSCRLFARLFNSPSGPIISLTLLTFSR